MKRSVRKPRTDGGTWSYRIGAGLNDRGRRRQREVGGLRTKKDARTSLKRGARRHPSRHFVQEPRTTVREFLDESHEGARTELALMAWVIYGQVIRLIADVRFP